MTLYIDYINGRFESYFYADGNTYKGKYSYDINNVLTWARKNDFNKIVLTEEAKLFRKMKTYE